MSNHPEDEIVKISVRINRKEYESAKAAARRQGYATVTEFCREAIRNEMRQRPDAERYANIEKLLKKLISENELLS